MNWKSESKLGTIYIAVFLGCYFIPIETDRFQNALLESMFLIQWYAQEHVILCLIPAFFIAGAIAAFLSQNAVMKYLGPQAPKPLAYGVASVSGCILAVCSCTVLPLFAGIYRMGAGLGPATAFLYSGPAINILAIILTAAVLGLELGMARGIGAVFFSIVIGLTMHFIFYREEMQKSASAAEFSELEVSRPLWQNAFFLFVLIAILVFANWAPSETDTGILSWIYVGKWGWTSLFGILLAALLVLWFQVKWIQVILAVAAVVLSFFMFPHQPLVPFIAGWIGLSLIIAPKMGELGDWFDQSWGFAKQILPLLLIGVLIAGMLLGRPGQEGWIPSTWVSTAVGGNSLQSNLFASVFGAFMYFATLTEIPILQGLIGNGMGKGPALALLLAGPALSLPNMLVIRTVLGTQKTTVYIILVIILSTLSGWFYGTIYP